MSALIDPPVKKKDTTMSRTEYRRVRRGAARVRHRTVYIAIAVLMGARGAAAQTGSPVDLAAMTLEQLLDIQVAGATKTQLRQMEVPQAITVLTRDDIRRIPAHNIADLLRSAVGANVVRVQTSQNVLGTRGSNALAPSQLLILIDGQPISPTLFSTTWWDLVPVAIGDIERIEFIRSPGTIYGANAQHGVVNIITARPDGLTPGHAVRAESEVGQQKLQQHYFGYRGATGETAYRVSTELMSIEAYRNPASLLIVPGRPSARGEQTFSTHPQQLEVQNVFGSVRAPLAGHTLAANVGVKHVSNAQGRIPDRLCFVGIEGSVAFANAEYSIKGGQTTQIVTVAADVANYTFLRNADPSLPSPAAPPPLTAGILDADPAPGGQLRASSRFNDADTCATSVAARPLTATRATAPDLAPSTLDPNRLDPASTRLTMLGAGYEAQATIGDAHRMVAGARYTAETGSNTGGTPFFTQAQVRHSPAVTAYVQDAIKLGDSRQLYLGGLFSDHYIAGTHLAPMVAYVQKLGGGHVLRLATFTSYRNPNVFESSMDYDQVTGAPAKRTRLVSNAHLEAERTISYEAGLRSLLTPHLLVSADVYWNQISDGIEWQLIGVDTAGGRRPRYQSTNTLQQRTRGVELELKYELTRSASIESNLAITEVSNRSTNPAYQGRDGKGVLEVGQGRYGSEYVPPYVFNTIVTFTPPRMQVRLHYQMVGGHAWQWPAWNSATGLDAFGLKPVPAYELLNAHVLFGVRPGFDVGLQADNLLNERHTEWRGDESFFGRSLSAKVRVYLGSSSRREK